MNLLNLIMMIVGIGIGMMFQRLFHIIEDSPSQPVKSKTKKSLPSSQKLLPPSSVATSDKTHRSDKSVLKSGLTKAKKLSKSASPALSPAVRHRSSKTNAAILSSPADVSMSNISPQSSTVEQPTSMATTQNITVTKLEDPLVALASKIEKVVSPRKAVIRPSQVICDCGVELMDDKEKYSEETTMPDSKHPITFANKTKILPMTYDRYRPLNLIHPPEGPTQISPFVTKKCDKTEDATLLTPFKPVLHSMYYAHRHALLIGDLLDNYDHLED